MNGPSEHGISGESMIGWGAIFTALSVFVIKLLPKADPRLIFVFLGGPLMRNYIEPVLKRLDEMQAESSKVREEIKGEIRTLQRTFDHMPDAAVAHARVREEDEEAVRTRKQWGSG
jgi:hypothetical protein